MPAAWAYAFRWPDPLDRLLTALNDVGPWRWEARDSGFYGDYLSARPRTGVQLRILESDGGYTVYADVDGDAAATRSELDATLLELLRRVHAADVKPAAHDL